MKKLSLICLAFIFSAGTVFAADNEKPRMKSGEMRGEMMHGMMQTPHHKLVMAYKKNLMNFAQALKSDIGRAEKVDKEFAETAVKEMRSSLNEIKKHHGETKNAMKEEVRAQHAEMIKMMESRLTTVGTHLDNVEKELKAEMPDPGKIRMELDQILKQCKMMKDKEFHKKKKMQ